MGTNAGVLCTQNSITWGVGSRKVGIEFRSDNPHGMAMIIKHRYADPAVGSRKVDTEFSLRYFPWHDHAHKASGPEA